MNRFLRAFSGSKLRERGKRQLSKLPQRTHSRLGVRSLQMESLETRQLLSITLPTISDTTLPAGTAIFVPLNGSDPGKTLSYAVTVSDYSKLTPVMMPQSNNSLQFNVDINGSTQSMTFQLFDNYTPITTEHIEQLVQEGFYDGLSIYRNQSNFVIQGGNELPVPPDYDTSSPIKTVQDGSEASTLLDEEFNPNLQYNTAGILAMARQGTPGTSSTEFFVTLGPARTSLDYNYTMFGIQTTGTDTRDAIAAKPTESISGYDYLLTPLTITSASIFNDTQNGVLELKAPEGVTGNVTVTVTAYDGTNTPVTQSFTVTIGVDSPSNPDNPFASVTPTAPLSVTYLPPTGTSSQITPFNNSDIDSTLDFLVTGVTDGNLVQILADGNVIGEEYASGTSVIVTTDGSTTLTNGIHKFTAIQISEGETVDVVESGDPDPIEQTADVPSFNSLALQFTVDTTTPVASLTAAGITVGGGTTHTFTVEYTDDVAVNVSMLDSSDILVTGPNGYSQLATFVSADSLGDWTPVTAIYQINAPGGTWDSTDNGTYTISIVANQVTDTDNQPVAPVALGTFLANVPPPTPQASLTAANITTSGGTTYAFTVQYTDDIAVNVSTLDSSDVRVKGPNGTDLPVTYVGVTPAGDGTPRTATYQINAPGVTWDKADNGTYTISMESGQVTDGDSNSVAAGTLGAFTVNILQTLTLTINTPSILEGGTTTGTITLSEANPTAATTIYLSSSDTTEATVPSTVTIPAGATSSDPFELKGVLDGIVDGTQSATITATAVGYTSGTATLSVQDADVAKTVTITISPQSILETGTATGTVTLSQGAPSDNFIVYLSSSDTTEATVPSTVTFTHAGDTTSAPFDITGMVDGIVDGTQSATITATAVGYTSGTATLSVQDADVAKTVTITISPQSILETGTATGTVTLSQGAPSDNFTVYLSSSDTTEATVPSTVTFTHAGDTTSAPFDITGMVDGIVDGTQSATITATAVGYTSGTAGLSVQDADVAKTIMLAISPSSILEGGTATGTITLLQAAPEGGLVVYLFNSDSTQATIPATATIAAGTFTGTFTINGVQDGIIDGLQNVTITASAQNYVSGTADLDVYDTNVPTTITVAINALSIPETGSTTGTVTLPQTVSAEDGLIVYLNSSDNTEATVPTTVTVLYGQTTATFAINGVADGQVDGDQDTTITATASGYTTGSNALTVTDVDLSKTIAVEISPTTFAENAGAGAATGTVTRTGPTDTDLVVTLSSNDPTSATVPTTVTILAGETSATFAVTAVDDTIFDGNADVTITAQASDYTKGEAIVTVIDNEQDEPLTISIGDVTRLENSGSFSFTITLSKVTSSSVGVLYATSNGTAASGSDYKAKSGTIIIDAGKNSATVVIPVYGDFTAEADETFFVTLSNASVSISKAQGIGTILNDDGGNLVPLGAWADTIGLFAPGTATAFLRNSNSAGVADATFQYGPANVGWQSIAGDWNGDGIDTIGLYNAATSTFYLKNTNTAGAADLAFVYGPAGSGWKPIVGDWDSDGIDTIGLYNPTTATFYLKDTNTAGVADSTFVFGTPGATSTTPIAGDWDGDGDDTIGLFDAANSMFHLRNTNSAGAADTEFVYGVVGSGWKPIVGDWSGDGIDTIGMYSNATATFYLREANSAGAADYTFVYGPAGNNWTPIVGDWNGAASPLSAAGGAGTNANAASITASDLQASVHEAIARWAATGLSTEALTTLANVKFAVADLSGATLGLADGDTIFIDRDAAGYGWFVDSTPWQDDEFSNEHGGRAIDPRAVDGIDLLTVVEHELGHILGYSDLDASLDDLMGGTLSAGVRRSAVAEVDAIFASTEA